MHSLGGGRHFLSSEWRYCCRHVRDNSEGHRIDVENHRDLVSQEFIELIREVGRAHRENVRTRRGDQNLVVPGSVARVPVYRGLQFSYLGWRNVHVARTQKDSGYGALVK